MKGGTINLPKGNHLEGEMKEHLIMGGYQHPHILKAIFPETDVSAIVLQQLEILGLMPELQGGEIDLKPSEEHEKKIFVLSWMK